MPEKSLPLALTSSRRTIGAGPVLASMALIEVLSGFTQQYLYPVLPSIGAEHGISTVQLSWIFVVQKVGMAVCTPLLARLGDNRGYRRMLRLSVAMVALGSLLMATWPTLATFVVGALLQGALVAFMPLTIGILRDRTGDAGARRGIGLLVGVLLAAVGLAAVAAGAAASVSPVLGLWVGVAAGALGMMACLVIPAEQTPPGGEKFPLLPFALLSVGLIGITLVLSQGPRWGWGSAPTAVSAAIGIAATVAWPFAELRAERPVVDVRMFRNARVTLLSVATFCLAFGTLGVLGANSTFLGASPHVAGYGFGLGSMAIGLAVLPQIGAAVAASFLTPRALRSLGDRAVMVAAGISALLGLGGLALLHDSLTGYVLL